eukprot:TRINITY_DN4949_c0_g1_i1.p1 TRINITY_DN4949_c0_g1~~TRINITY_DN4949_c0_g1_i1.p1  ORF type:complete len:228 (-),score=11.14 TRINITY_DN4949_c0_g1_i1:264-947(-)
MFFFFQAEDGIRDLVRSRGLGDVYKRQHVHHPAHSSRRSLPMIPSGVSLECHSPFPLVRQPTPLALSLSTRPSAPLGTPIAMLLSEPAILFSRLTFPSPPGARGALSVTRRLARQGFSLTAASECCGPRHLAKRARRSYELLKTVLPRIQPRSEEPSWVLRMVCGSCSGVTAVLCTLPFDTLLGKLRRAERRPVLEMRVALPRVAIVSALCLPLFDLARRCLSAPDS